MAPSDPPAKETRPILGFDWPRVPVSAAEAELVAERLRDSLCSDPWYAQKAEQVTRETGDPMAYWRDLAGSQIRCLRPPTKPQASGPADPAEG